jgi:tRNA (mo5U34)-methyltransferase
MIPAPGPAAAYIYDRLFSKHFDSARAKLAAAPNRAPAPKLDEGNLSEEGRRLWAEVNQIEWYHSIPLAPGIVTPGQFDHNAETHRYPVPQSLAGKRVLEIAAYDGFWSFLMEKRGAAESFAIDIGKVGDFDMPPALRASLSPEFLAKRTGDGFRLAHRVLQSKVERVAMSVYDLDENSLGQFDFVFMSDLLVHIMNPLRALQNIRKATRGEAVFVESFNPLMPGTLVRYKGFNQMIWWAYSLGALEKMILDAGFREVELYSKFRLGKRVEKPWNWHAAFVARV